MNSDKLDTIKDDEVLVRMLNRLNISDKQLKFIVRKIKADKEIIESRMTDSEIKEVNKELRSSKWSRISSSRTINKWRDCLLRYYRVLAFTEELNTFLVQEKQKFGIRIQTLNDRISQLRIANAYIIEDINWLSQK